MPPLDLRAAGTRVASLRTRQSARLSELSCLWPPPAALLSIHQDFFANQLHLGFGSALRRRFAVSRPLYSLQILAFALSCWPLVSPCLETVQQSAKILYPWRSSFFLLLRQYEGGYCLQYA